MIKTIFMIIAIITTVNTCATGCSCFLGICTSCVNGYYSNGIFSCAACSYKCYSCSDASSCDNCISMRRVLPSCNCGVGYYDSGVQICSICPIQCQTCSSNTVCTTCSSSTRGSTP